MTELWAVILGLAAGTFAARLGGVLIGQRLPKTGGWARALGALPGSLIIALVAMQVLSGGVIEWIAGALAAVTALATRNLILTMAVGIVAVYLLRNYS